MEISVNICTAFVQCRPDVLDVGPTLHKCYTHVLCLLENHLTRNSLTRQRATMTLMDLGLVRALFTVYIPRFRHKK